MMSAVVGAEEDSRLGLAAAASAAWGGLIKHLENLADEGGRTEGHTADWEAVAPLLFAITDLVADATERVHQLGVTSPKGQAVSMTGRIAP